VVVERVGAWLAVVVGVPPACGGVGRGDPFGAAVFAFSGYRDGAVAENGYQAIYAAYPQVIPEGAGPVKTTAAFAFACFEASLSWLGASK
jgi:hypothetical protein